MSSDRIRAFWKKIAPLALGAAVLGGVGGVAVKYLNGSCCVPGSPCCHPGSPCCHGHGASGGVAQR
ncbi:MAG: hypothetical protein ACLQVI_37135 [Polyangiaceae bacterium]|jgi:hypothetical protein